MNTAYPVSFAGIRPVWGVSFFRSLLTVCVLVLAVSCGGGGGSGGGGGGGNEGGSGNVTGDGNIIGDGNITGGGNITGDGNVTGGGNVTGDGNVTGGGNGTGGGSTTIPLSFADESIVGMNVSIDGDYRELRSQRSASFSATLLCSGVCDEEREVLFFRSLDDEISLQDEEVESLLLSPATGVQELTVRFEAGRPGHYYYGICIGEHCSAGGRLVVSGVAVMGVDVSADLVENDDRLNVTTELFCYGREPCSDFPVNYYRATGEDGASFLRQEVPTLANDMAAEDTIEDIVDYIVNATYYGCAGPFSAEYCMSSRVSFDDEDGDGLSPRHDIDDDGDGLIELETAAELNNARYVPDGSGYRTSMSAVKDTMGCPPTGCVGYELTADIDLAADGRYDDNSAGWQPIGNPANAFNAHFDGNGFTIRNLFINRPTEDNIGLFGSMSRQAVLNNIHLTNISVAGRNRVGGLVGFLTEENAATRGTISRSSVQGAVNGDGIRVGGIIGSGHSLNLTSSSAHVIVHGENLGVGGLIGFGEFAMVANSSVVGDISSSAREVGGLIGYGQRAMVANSSVVGDISGSVRGVGGLIGVGDEPRISASYARVNVSGGRGNDGEVGGFIGKGVRIQIDHSYAIVNVTGIGDNVGGLVGNGPNAQITRSYAQGRVEGSRHRVGGIVGGGINLNITSSSAQIIVRGENLAVGGLIGFGEFAVVANSSVGGDISSSGKEVGGLIGFGGDARISDSQARVNVSGGNGDTGEVGGFIGKGSNIQINHSYAIVHIVGTGSSVGGLIGNGPNARITSSYTKGRVEGKQFDVGGLIGRGRDATIMASFSLSDIYGGQKTAGLISHSGNAQIMASYARGNITAVGSRAGNLISNTEDSLTPKIDISYAAIDFKMGHRGGLIGHGTGNLNNTYHDREVSRVSGPEGRTTQELQTGISADGTTRLYAAWREVTCPNDPDTPIWDFGSIIEYPAIRCTPGGVATQRMTQQQEYSGTFSLGNLDVNDVTPRAAQDLTLSVKLRCNNGRCTPALVEYYRSEDQHITPDDSFLKGESLQSLAADQEILSSVRIQAEDAGDYYYGVCSGNVCTAGVLIKTRAVLMLEGFTTNNSSPVAAEDILLSATAFCGGVFCIEPIRYYYSADPFRDSSDTNVGQKTASLGPNQRDTISIDISAAAENGTHYYYACIDDDCTSAERVIIETDEDGDGIFFPADIDDDGDIDDDNDGLIEIITPRQLSNIRHALDGTGYRETATADLNTAGCPDEGCRGYELVTYIDLADFGESSGWMPIGNPANAFNAHFDGNGFTIRNLFINRPTENNIGLFGSMSRQAVLNDIHLTDINVTGRESVGGLVGFLTEENTATRGTISRSSVHGAVNGKGARVGGIIGSGQSLNLTSAAAHIIVRGETLAVGGFIGFGRDAMVINSSVVGNISSSDRETGGFIGFGGGAHISDSYAFVNVSGGRGNNGQVGGFIGSGGNIQIDHSYAIAHIVGTGNAVGGLIGSGQNARITRSYTKGSVEGKRFNVGGLIGLGGGATIIASFSLNDVTGGWKTGGIIGEGGRATITASYARGNITANPSRVGSLIGETSNSNIDISYVVINFKDKVGPLIGSGGGNNLTNSYEDREVSGVSSREGRTTQELQTGISADGTTSLYAAWREDTCPNDPDTLIWDFVSSIEYPAIRCTPGGVAAQRMSEQPEEQPDTFSLGKLDVNDVTPRAAQDLTLSVNLSCRNERCSRTIVEYYRSADENISPTDSFLRGEPLPSLAADKEILSSVRIQAEDTGNYYYGACVGNVCTTGIRIEIQVVLIEIQAVLLPEKLTISNSFPPPGESISLAATVLCTKNPCTKTIRYYYSADPFRDSSDTNVGQKTVSLGPNQRDTISIDISAAENGIHYYYACIDDACTSAERVIIEIDEDEDGIFFPADIDDDGDIDDDNDGLIEIITPRQLSNIRHALDGTGYRENATADLNTAGCPDEGCRGYELITYIDLADFGESSGWMPIGNPANAFNAHFDGNGFTIRNLFINRPTENNIGLFGSMSRQAVLNDIHLMDINVTGRERVGGLVGFLTEENAATRGTISRSSVRGAVNGKGVRVGGIIGSGQSLNLTSAAAHIIVRGETLAVGGFIGFGRDAMVINSSVVGDISSSDREAGGFIGYGGDARISDSQARVNVKGGRGNDGQVGGFIGNGGNIQIDHSYAIAHIVGTGNSVGGLIGSGQNARITRSYTKGSVEGTRYYVGGLIGLGRGATIIASFSLNDVTGGWKTGGIIGESSRATITASYARGNVTGSPSRIGSLIGETSNSNINISYVVIDFKNKDGPLIGSGGGNSLTNSYEDREVSGVSSNEGRTTQELQTGISADGTTSLYAAWRKAACPNDPDIPIWDFGSTIEYPVIRCTPGGVATQRMPEQQEEYPGTLSLGELDVNDVTLSVKLQCNNGRCIPALVEYYRSEDQHITPDDSFLRGGSLQSLAADQEISSSAQIQTEDIGNYYYGACIGNVCTAGVRIEIQAVLLPEKLTISNNFPPPGESISLAATALCTRNPCAKTIRYYYSADPFRDSSDTNIGQKNVSLGPNQRDTISIDISAAENGIHYYYACIDDVCTSAEHTIIKTDEDGDGIFFPADRDDYGDIDDDNDGLIEIITPQQLSNIRHALNGTGYRETATADLNTAGCPAEGCRGYELVRHIDLANFSESSGWMPIGNSSNAFNAHFDGNGFTIRNLFINRSTEDNIGLFGTISRQVVLNDIHLTNISVAGRERVGGLVGSLTEEDAATRATISRSSVQGTVNGKGVGEMGHRVGGIIGSGKSLTLTSSSADVIVRGENLAVGGLIGFGNDAMVINSSIVGDISGSAREVGGLIGFGNDVRILDSHALVNVRGGSGNDAEVGGFVGKGRGIHIDHSYAVVNIVGAGTAVGGLVGSGDNTRIRRSYTKGSVRGSRFRVGGLIGHSVETRVVASFSLSDVTGGDCISGLIGCARSFNEGVVASYARGRLRGTSSGPRGGSLSTGLRGGQVLRSTNSYAAVSFNNNIRSPRFLKVVTGARAIIFNSYDDREVSGVASPEGRTTQELQTGISADGTTSLYAAWREDTCPNDPDTLVWDFGSTTEYPAIRCTPGGVATQRMAEQPEEHPDTFSLGKLDVNDVTPRAAQDLTLSVKLSCRNERCIPALVEYYRSADENISPDDSFLREEPLPSLVADKEILSSVQIQAEDTGNYYYGACIGNVCTAGIRIETQAVLLPEKLTISNSFPIPGESISLAATVLCTKNSCTKTIRFYYSADPFRDSSDTNIGQETVSVGSNQRDTISIDISAAAESGSHFYYACIEDLCSMVKSVLVVNKEDEDGDGIFFPADIDDDGDIDDDNDGLIEIITPRQLSNIRHALDGTGYRENATADLNTVGCPAEGCRGYELITHIDLGDFGESSGWMPIGNPANAFNAHFDGNGFTIRNLFINRSTENNIGLFGSMSRQAVLNDIHLTDSNVAGRERVGGLVGFLTEENAATRGTISRSSVHGAVNGKGVRVGGIIGSGQSLNLTSSSAHIIVRGETRAVGGLIGFGRDAMVINSSVVGDISSSAKEVGGFIGFGGDARISDSYAFVNVSGGRGNDGDVGGFIGNGRNIQIDNSYAVAHIVGTGNSVGGLIGWGENARITRSYTKGRVEGGRFNVGGLIGWGQDARVIASFSLSDLYGNEQTAGLIGRSGNAQITASYARGNITTFAARAGSLISNTAGSAIPIIHISYAAIDFKMNAGPLIGWGKEDKISSSYDDSEVSGVSSPEGRTTQELHAGITTDGLTDLYAAWQEATCPNDPNTLSWDFGTDGEYPAIRCTPGGVSTQRMSTTVVQRTTRQEQENQKLTSRSTKEVVTVQKTTNRKNIKTVILDKLTVSDDKPRPAQDITLSVYLSCSGETCPSALVQYYRSKDGRITPEDKLMKEDIVRSLVHNENRILALDLQAEESGNYYYGACLGNSCTLGVRIETKAVLTLEDLTVDNDSPEIGEDILLSAGARCAGNPCVETISYYSSRSPYRIGAEITAISEAERVISLSPGRTATQNVLLREESPGAFYYYACIKEDCSDSLKVIFFLDEDGDGIGAHEDIDDDGSIDDDGDGLIELRTARQVSNMRYSLDGRSYKEGARGTAQTYHCPVTDCHGYELAADIDLTAGGDAIKGWKPIGNKTEAFRAFFDGNNFILAGLFINRTDDDNIGLFGQVNEAAEIENVRLIDADVTGRNNVGALIGYGENSTIVHSSVKGNIRGESSIGGFSGKGTVTIMDSNMVGHVEGRSQVGGFIGDAGAAMIKSSYVIGNVSGTSTSVGGLVGMGTATTIYSSFAVSKVKGGSSIGGLIGQVSQGTIANSYAFGHVEGSQDVGGLIGNGGRTRIRFSYAGNDIIASGRKGGLSGSINEEPRNSYWDSTVNRITTENDTGLPQTTVELQNGGSSLYFHWDTETCPDEPDTLLWDFGTSTEYPVIRCVSIGVAEQRRIHEDVYGR